MKDTITIREYGVRDKTSVLNLFRLNTPKYFATEEEKDLIQYLENEIEYYFVIEIDNVIIGNGGFNFSENKNISIVSWDFIHPDFQRKSLGSLLMKYRIERLKNFKDIQKIKVRTSQLAYKFYEKQGFKILEIIEDYWAKGFHLYSMEYINIKRQPSF